jgi:hypothetical protein
MGRTVAGPGRRNQSGASGAGTAEWGFEMTEQQAGDQSGTGQQQQSQAPGGLLAGEAALQAEGEGQQQSSGEQAPATVEGLRAELDGLRTSFQSEVDRRVNQVVSTLRGEMARLGPTQPPSAAQPPPIAATPPLAGPPQVSNADLREARMVYREYVNESLQFLGPQERALAQDLSQAQLLSAMQSGMDPDTAGRQVASQVTARITDARGMYEQSVVNALRRSGQLTEGNGGASSVRHGQQVPAGRTQDTSSSFAKGAAMAAEIGRAKAAPAG